MTDIPIVDMSLWYTGSEADKDKLATEFGDACSQWGFALVGGHGLDPDLLERVRAATLAFFDLPLADKMSVEAALRPGKRGYYPMKSKSHARTLGKSDAPGDLRESYHAGTEPKGGQATAAGEVRHIASNVWPSQIPQMKESWSAYLAVCNRVATDLLRVSARALNLSDDWFDDKIDRPISNLTAQHYPALAAPPRPGELRSGAHTDFGTLTLLMTEDKPGGLQVQSLEGEWTDLRPVPGAFIVNLGDLMAQWTNNRWRSTMHRVVNPPMDAGSAARRLSIVYFHSPNYDALIECIPSCTDAEHPPQFPPVLAGEHLAEKLRKTDSVAEKT